MVSCYIASGWFNPAQAQDLENIKTLLIELRIDFISPKDVLVLKSDSSAEDRERVFQNNYSSIKETDFIIVNTRDKDMGTLFEAGIAHSAGRPIIYYCDGLTGSFNVMLAQSGMAVATGLKELKFHLLGYLNNRHYKEVYNKKIE